MRSLRRTLNFQGSVFSNRNDNSSSPGKFSRSPEDEFPLPKLGFKPSLYRRGLKIFGDAFFSGIFQLILGLTYYACGLGQFICGIKYMLELPIFQLGSNIWTGALNILSGVIIASFGSCCGPLSPLKARGVVLLSFIVSVINIINLVILEVGEWRSFLTDEDKRFMKEKDLEYFFSVAYYATTICTALSMVLSLIGCLNAYCFIRVRKESEVRQLFSSSTLLENNSSKFSTRTDLTSDFINGQDNNLNLKTPAGPQPHPSWVYRHTTSNTTSNQVKRSISHIGVGKALSPLDRIELFSNRNPTLRKQNGGIQTISENVSDILSTGISKFKSPALQHRTAQIRRHQSMYINPTSAEYGSTLVHSKKKQREGRSGLKRSATSAGAYSSQHYNTYKKFKETYRKLHEPDTLFCEFQAGKSFDLPDPNKLSYGGCRDNSWAEGSSSCVMLTTYEDDDDIDEREFPSSDDSGHHNIRYQAIDGLVQDSRPYKRNIPLRHSSLENLLDSSADKVSSRGLIRYNSTGSISSAGSDRNKPVFFNSKTNEEDEIDAFRRSCMTQTPTSVGSQDNKRVISSVVGSEEEQQHLLYDVPRRRNASLKKSNSRVSSSGKLRLRVESFREEQQPPTSSAETQTDGKYTGQFGNKKHSIPPKPVRKHKPTNSSRSDRSASPDNSSTSGYSSPSASGSKESPTTGNDSRSKNEEITVIQIVPAEAKRQFFHRELPRIATNGTLQRTHFTKQARVIPGDNGYAGLTTLPRRNDGRRGVPLPPVPELERSDHERSISPQLNRQLYPQKDDDKFFARSEDNDIEEKLKVLLHLINQNDQLCNNNGEHLSKEILPDNGEEDAVEYLSQLESVARRLKHHYLQKDVPNKVLTPSS